jgi:membrane-bound lytic murein transglycosylase D
MGVNVRAAQDPFPVYPVIQPSVSFWKKIYTEYSTSQGVIHDKYNLSIIYDVIDLKDRDRHGSREINRNRIKKAKKKYKMILSKIASGGRSFGSEEQRVANLFGVHAKPTDFITAMRNIRCQVGQKDPFRTGIIRSGAYLEEIKQIFSEYGLPEDLVYLPHVESSFNPKAYSKFGAAGIWQFTRSTGKRYMTIGYAVDERRDPIRASVAAARLLKQNYKKFKNWPMAITAYNHGVAGMLRAQRIKGDYEAIFREYRSRIFKFASRNFYSEFLAAREVAKNYQQYFGELRLDAPIETGDVVLAGYASLPEIARHLNLEIDALHQLNRALRNPVRRGQKYIPKGYHLRLPTQAVQEWETLMAESAPEIFKNNQKRSRIYKVRRGDTAGKITQMYGVKLRDLIAANNLDARATIYVNQNLRIPLPDEKGALLYGSKSFPLKKASVAGSHKPTPTLERPGPKPSQLLAHLETHATEANNGLTEIRRRGMEKKSSTEEETYIDFWAIRKAPPAKSTRYEVAQENLAIKRVWKQRGRPIGMIQVEVEETLGHYADWLGIPTQEIRRLNGFRYGRKIRIHQPTKIPLHKVTKEQFEEKRFEYHNELSEDFFASYRVEKVQVYCIEKGDNIWTLSREKFEVPLWLVKRYNAEIDFSLLRPSQKLVIPVVEKIV